jgi:hypothetical protein
MATVNENVQYTLSLKDLLTGKLGEANAAAKSLESTMGAVKGALGFLGVGFAVFKGGEFVKESLEKFHQLEQATAQVRAGLVSTKGAAGMTFQDVEESAKSLASQMKYSRAEIMSMQSVLLTFPSVTKGTFNEASEMIADMSTRLGQDLKSSAIQVGKALQDPIKGVTALRRVGVNFNETQTNTIKRLAQTGQMAKAQTLILRELATEFKGSALAAAMADPLFEFNKSMGSFSLNIGEAANSILETLLPALGAIGEKFSELGEYLANFFKEFKNGDDSVISFTKVVYAAITGIGIAVQGLWKLVQAVINGIGVATKAMVGAYNYVQDIVSGNSEKAKKDFDSTTTSFNKMVEAMKGPSLKDAVNDWMGAFDRKDAFYNLKNQIKEVKEEYQDSKNESLEEYKNKLDALREKIAGNKFLKEKEFSGLNTLLADAARARKKNDILNVEGDNVTSISAKGATGQKSVTINVSIGKLIESFKVSTTTMKEGANQVEEMVANAMLRAINEFQVHASV